MIRRNKNGTDLLPEFAATSFAGRWKRLDKGQLIKWTVYTLLLINWGYYAVEEFYVSSHVLKQGGTFLQWTREFATTIDEFAWFGLLFMFELETYALDESLDKRPVRWGIHGLRLVCYLFLAHTVYARVNSMVDVFAVQPSPEITSLCQLTDRDIDFGMNYHYEPVTRENCGALSAGPVYYMVEPSVVMDSEGLALEKKYAYIDFQDAIMWLLVVWAIELAVWLQNRNIAGGPLMVLSHAARAGYAILFAHAIFWAWAGHWVWAWDQFLWIAGFWAIEHNVSEWREEIIEESEKLQA